MAVKPLSVEALTSKCDERQLKFDTTKDLDPLQGLIAQEKAMKAIDFGLSIKKRGYNVYVSGNWGSGRTSYVMQKAEKQAANQAVPCDWLYVYNFKDARNPKAIFTAPGQGAAFVKAIEGTIIALRNNIKKLFLSKEYENSKSQLFAAYHQQMDKIIAELNVIAKKHGFKFSENEKGLVSIPLKDGAVMSEEEYNQLTDEELEDMRQRTEKLTTESVDHFNQLRAAEADYREKLSALDSQSGAELVSFQLEKVAQAFELNDSLKQYFIDLAADVVENIERFKGEPQADTNSPMGMFVKQDPEAFFERYRINLLVDHAAQKHAPIVFESNPTFQNLIGSIEFYNELGVLKTDLKHIKAGALHKANGGFLILHAKDLLLHPYAWSALKRAMLDEEIAIESVESSIVHATLTTLKPQPIPLDVKIIIIGDGYTHYILNQYDESFSKLFKITADFDVEMPRDEDNIQKLARYIAKHCQEKDLKPFDASAVARIVQFASRLVDDQTKMSTHLNSIIDILIESDAWASVKGDVVVTAHHVNTALEEKRDRSNQYEEKVLQMFDDGTYLIDVEGEKVGEINGLAVVGASQYSFGKPSKITVSTFRGQAGIVNIEREANTSGKIHDKGVLIISGYLGYMYAQDKPLSLTATIVFEQLYSGVDGDSASSTELYAILSSLSGVPIKQNLAVTGSVNQRGEIQPIGGVNEKIEGFYHVCRLKGLTGDQGVIIPHQNVKNLMLSEDVVEAVRAGMFHIYPVKTIDEGIELLMGQKAGVRTKNGSFSKGSIHYKVDQKIVQLAESLREA